MCLSPKCSAIVMMIFAPAVSSLRLSHSGSPEFSSNITTDSWVKTLIDGIKHSSTRTGGLTFNTPELTALSPEIIDMEALEMSAEYAEMVSNEMQKTNPNPVLRDIGEIMTVEMAREARFPVVIKEVVVDKLHRKLMSSLKGKGCMDMLVKAEQSSKIVLPSEIKALTPILEEAAVFEKTTNPHVADWNLFLLLDTRPVHAAHSQRNAGYHFDGLNTLKIYQGKPLLSCYIYATRLPTLAYTGTTYLPEDFDPLIHNGNTFAQRQVKNPKNVTRIPMNTLVKIDAVTNHGGDDAQFDITDRVFIRACFTPPGYYFDRKGNTVNPAFLKEGQAIPEYGKSYNIWPSFKDGGLTRIIPDNAAKLINTVEFNSAEELKNHWDVACLGHHAFAMVNERERSHEYQLVRHMHEVFIVKKLHLDMWYDMHQMYETEAVTHRIAGRHKAADVSQMRIKLLQLYLMNMPSNVGNLVAKFLSYFGRDDDAA